MKTHHLSSIAATIGLLSSFTAANNSRNDTAACVSLLNEAAKNLANLTVNHAEYVQAGTNYNDTANGGFNPTTAFNIPEHCRFSANITTSNMSSVRFEVWMPPKDIWNSRFLMVGNGGDNGYVQYDTMNTFLSKYNFSVTSTNTGHDGDVGNGSFAFKNPESQIDFGYRAVHLTAQYAKEITKLFYDEKASYNYWAGCSSGGKQGLKEAQAFPDDFDGILAGAPANSWSHLNGWTQYVNSIVDAPGSEGYISPPEWTSIHGEVIAQCDNLDGVQDGVINQPGHCFLDYNKFRCNGTASTLNSTTCLSDAQVQTFIKTHTNWTDPATGEFLFPAFNLGAEYLFAASVTGTPFGPAPNYFLYQVLNVSELVLPYDTPNLTINGAPVNETQLIDLVYEADKTDPGRTIAINPDLSPYFDKGGKLILYVGTADFLIPNNNTFIYHQSVVEKLGNTSNNMQFYPIPGMGHCSGGAGASNVGLANQGQTVLGGTSQSPPGEFNAKHDALLALMAWTEKGERPETLIATKFVGDNINNATLLTRKLCPFPLISKYMGGDVNDESSFECKL